MFKESRALDVARTAKSFDQAYSLYQSKAESWFDGSVGSVDRRLSACERLLHAARATTARLSTSDSARYLRATDILKEDQRVLAGLREDLLNGASGRADVVGPPGWRTAHWFKDDGSYQCPAGGPHPSQYSSPHEYLHARNLHDWINQSRDMTPGGGDVQVDEAWRSPTPTPSEGPQQLRNPSGANPLARHTAALESPDKRWVTLESAKFIAANSDALDSSVELATRAHNYAATKTSTFTTQRSAAICKAFVGAVTDLGARTYRPRLASAPAPDPVIDPQAIYLC